MTERLRNALNYLTDELRRSRRGNLDDYPGSDDDDPPMDAIEVETEHSGAMECIDHDHDGGCDYQEDHDSHSEDGYDAHDHGGEDGFCGSDGDGYDGECGDSDHGDD